MKSSDSEQVLIGQRGAAAGNGSIDDSLAIYDLEDEMVKLVAYTIVSVRRDAEHVMPEGEGTFIVTDSMNNFGIRCDLDIAPGVPYRPALHPLFQWQL